MRLHQPFFRPKGREANEKVSTNKHKAKGLLAASPTKIPCTVSAGWFCIYADITSRNLSSFTGFEK